MLNLNLASPTTKKEIRIRRANALVTRTVYPLIILALLLAAYLAAGNFALTQYLKRMQEQAAAAFISEESYDIRLKTLNAELDYIENIQKEHAQFSSLFYEISVLADHNLKFTGIQANKDNKSIILRGTAVNRDGLLEFKSKLEESASFDDVNLPIASLLQRENINFEITAKIIKYGN